MTNGRLYYCDSYIQTFQTRVIKCEQISDRRYAVILSETVFYPESGGQPADSGFLNNVPVIDVQEDGNAVVHILEQPINEQAVTGRINWKRRFDHMQQHSGQHILSGAFYTLFGTQTIGFHMGPKSSQIDLELEKLRPKDIQAVEDLANRVVFDNSPVNIHFADKKSLANFILRKLPAKDFDTLRLIQIGDIDCTPCGGTHVARTGEVGLIKIRCWERKNNAVRVDFVCGGRAMADYQQKNSIISSLTAALSVPVDGVENALAIQNERFRQLEKKVHFFKESYFKELASNLIAKAKRQNGALIIKHLISGQASSDAGMLAKALVNESNKLALIGSVNEEQDKAFLVFACSADVKINMAEVLKAVLPIINGKGGGSARFAQGGGKPDGIIQALTAAEKILS